ncbi:MAG TPA: PHP domain-containing protein, partial [Roseateles sp.]|uniref:PHP domain-containing protein n=1 Tax=Roseateles sp. TaxID=1971397 RepID=UPI002EDA6FC2
MSPPLSNRDAHLHELRQPHELPRYAELHCLTAFSFLRGASEPQELVERAITQGYEALAITDECSLAGVVRAHKQLR